MSYQIYLTQTANIGGDEMVECLNMGLHEPESVDSAHKWSSRFFDCCIMLTQTATRYIKMRQKTEQLEEQMHAEFNEDVEIAHTTKTEVEKLAIAENRRVSIRGLTWIQSRQESAAVFCAGVNQMKLRIYGSNSMKGKTNARSQVVHYERRQKKIQGRAYRTLITEQNAPYSQRKTTKSFVYVVNALGCAKKLWKREMPHLWGEKLFVAKSSPRRGSPQLAIFYICKSLQRNLIFLYVIENITIEFEVEFQGLRFKLRCSNLHSNFFFRFFFKKFRYIFNGKKISNGYLDFIFHCTVNKVR